MAERKRERWEEGTREKTRWAETGRLYSVRPIVKRTLTSDKQRILATHCEARKSGRRHGDITAAVKSRFRGT